MHGNGTFYYANENRYEGSFKENKLSGHGTFYYANGDCYTGEYKNDMMHGRGEFRFLLKDNPI